VWCSYISELTAAVAERMEVAASAADRRAHSALRMYGRTTRRIADDFERLLTDIRHHLDVQLRPTASVSYL